MNNNLRLLKTVSIANVKNLKYLSSTSPAWQAHYDIVVAGGGMVGTTLACTLSKNKRLSNKKILLLEGSKESNFNLKDTYSNRVSALNPATRKLFQDIGAWQHIEEARYGPVKKLQVWDACSDAMISFDNSGENVAYIVENDVILHAVLKQLKNVSNLDVVYEAKVKSCKQEKTGDVAVQLDNGGGYTCQLLLGCDGANSQIRKSMDFHYISQNYNHMGIVATVKLPEEFENVVAWQRQLPSSSFVALLPLKNGLSSLVWSTGAARAKELLNLPEEQFVEAVNEGIWKRYPQSSLVEQATKTLDSLAKILNLPSRAGIQLPPKIIGVESGSRAAFPLEIGHATNYVAQGVALVGDAAHRVHPLAGQGVNLGFGDVIELNKVLSKAVYAGGKLGSLVHLKEYETARQRHNVGVLLAVHGIFHLWGNEWSPLVLLRSLGLQATHALTPLKKVITAQASGL